MAVTLIAAVATGFGAAVGIAGVTFSWAAFAISAGFSLVARALTPKPDLGAQIGGQSVMTRDPAQSRKIIYGRTRVGANVVYLESTGADNKYLWLVGAVAAHEIDGYESVWFNDEKIWDSSQGYYNNWGGKVQIRFFTGSQTVSDNANDSTSISPRTDNLVNASNNKWTTDHKLLDTAYMVIRLEHDVDKFSSGLPNISTIIRGKKVLDLTNSTTAGNFVVGTKYKILSLSNSGTATNFTAIGAASNTVGLEFRATGVGAGTGQARIFSWSQNNALCLYDYLRDTKYGLGEIDDNILISSVITAKGVCDQAVQIKPASDNVFQPRYTINGVVDTAGTLKSNIEIITGSMAGRLVYSGGKFEIYAGRYVAPAFTVDASQILGDITVQTKQSRRNVFNGVKGVFLSEDDNYVLADYPAQISSTFAAQDGDPIYLDMALPFTTGSIRAQRLAKLALLRSRQEEAITIPCNLSALRFKIGDNINVNYPDFGYSAKIFEVVGYSIALSADGQIIVNVQAIETAANIWNWTTSDEQVFLDGGTVELYDGSFAERPASLTAVATTFQAGDGTTNSSFTVNWPISVDAFIDRYVVEWRLANPSNQPFFSQETKLAPFSINNLQNGQLYNIRIKAINELGVSSAYRDASSPTALNDITAPAVPTEVTAVGEFEQISVSWINPTVKDFKHVEVYRSNTTNGTYEKLGEIAGTTYVDTGLLLVNGAVVQRFYKLKSVDQTGNKLTAPNGGFSAKANATTTLVPIGGIDPNAVDTDQIADEAVEIDQIAASLQSTNYSSGSAGWKILKSGVVEFEQATIRGEVIAATGSIGGYTINSNSLFAGSGNTRVSLSTADGISLGSNTFGSAPFRVTRAGALTATSAIITGNITATDLTVTNATVTGVFAANNVPNMQNLNGVIAANQINAGTIAVNKLTGDVTELYPISLFPSSSMGTSGTTIYQDFWIPTPDLNLSKRQKVTADFAFTLNNTTSTSHKIFFQYGLQLKSKSALGISVGTVTHVSNPLSNHQLVSIPGNQLEKLDNQGSVAKTNNASGGSNAAATVRAVWFDHDDNKTYVLTANLGNTFSTNDTMFFSASKFASAGSFVSPNLIGQSAMYVPAGIELKVTLPLSNTFGASTTATNLRPFVIAYTNMNNVTGTFNYFKGTMENVS